MNKYASTLVATLAVIVMCTATARAHDLDNGSLSFDSHSINLDHGDVIIHGNDGTVARITAVGTLLISGKPQTVTPAQQRQLSRYVATVKDMQAQGLVLSRAAAPFAASIVSEVLDAVFSGASEDQIDRVANRHAHDFAKKALPICQDAQTLKQLQDTLAASLPAFRPYAVIEGHDVNDCQHDINSDD